MSLRDADANESAPSTDESANEQDREDGDTETDHTPTLERDQIFHLLQNQRRRLVLRYLQDESGEVKMRDVAEQVAAWEHDTTVQALTSEERQRVYIPLYQNHLPKLADEGIIEYNQSRGIVRRLSLADELDPYLQYDEDETEGETEAEPASWSTYYVATSVVGAVVLAGMSFRFPFFEPISGFMAGTLILLAFSVLTAAQYLRPKLV
ncbi:hypothetical protein VB773_13075 [Haloarculaceae archaeon H-GB2-1]|nr:hypothetical protein [Haloarculaceae archaeon H-GB1-1]MEA5408403.1 hypothetical protein [Haloarculaceae archaeon H-GB2-1]